jgi:hypothetical protein
VVAYARFGSIRVKMPTTNQKPYQIMFKTTLIYMPISCPFNGMLMMASYVL